MIKEQECSHIGYATYSDKEAECYYCKEKFEITDEMHERSGKEKIMSALRSEARNDKSNS